MSKLDLIASSQQTVVIVGTLRGKADAWQWASGLGGIPREELVKMDVSTFGQTWLWEPLSKLVAEISPMVRANPQASCRLFLLDLSGSMAKRKELLQRMWASIPKRLSVQGIEIMIVTDGQDNESEPPFKGNQGLAELIKQATALGWDCGQPIENPIGKLYITLLDVEGTVVQELASQSLPVTLIATQNLDLLASVIRSPRPNQQGHLSEEQCKDLWPALAPQELEEISVLEAHLGKPYDLERLIALCVGVQEEASRGLVKAAILRILKALILDNANFPIDRRGQVYHTQINAILYDLQKHHIVEKIDRNWHRGPGYELVVGQLCSMLPPAFDLQASVNQLINSADLGNEIKETLKRYPDQVEELIIELVQQAKRVKK